MSARTDAAVRAPAEARAVVEFWADAGPGLWFAKDPAFDRRFRDRFLAPHEAAARGGAPGGAGTAPGSPGPAGLLRHVPRGPKSTPLDFRHPHISYYAFCVEKKKKAEG